jgi:hypothetical protein
VNVTRNPRARQNRHHKLIEIENAIEKLTAPQNVPRRRAQSWRYACGRSMMRTRFPLIVPQQRSCTTAASCS